MLNAMHHAALIALMFVWDRTIGGAIPLSVLDRMLSRRTSSVQQREA